MLAAFVFVCVYFVGIYPGAPDSNQRSHYQLLRALAERGEAEIGPEIAALGSHTDVAIHEGRRYSNKAPGLSVAAVPGYLLGRLLLPMPASSQDWLVFYGARVLSVTLVVTLALVVFVREALRVATPSTWLPIWLFALLFATPFQVYARSFFSHAFVAALLFLSFVLVTRRDSPVTALGAGFLAGLAVSSEYPAVVIVLCLLLVAATLKPSTRLLAFAGGGALPAGLLGWYHARHFGSVFASPSAASESYPMLSHHGVVGVSWPNPVSLVELFLDPAHGLLYFSPFLVLWPVVALLALRGLNRDRSLVVPVLGPLLLLILVSGVVSPHWRGGWGLGPRYLVAGFVLLFWLFVVRVRSITRPLQQVPLLASIAYGTVIVAICGSTFWLIPYETWNPARTLAAHLLKRGVVEYNLGIALGLPPLFSLVPPLLACAGAFLAAAYGIAIRPRTLVAATLLGFLAAGAVLSIPPSPAAVANSQRSGIASALQPTMQLRWR